MKFGVNLWILCLCPLLAMGQGKTPPPPAKKVTPGKDPVMIFDYLLSGRSKQYAFSGGTAGLAVTGNVVSGNFVNLIFNGQHLMSRAPIAATAKNTTTGDVTLKLTRNSNMLVINADRESVTDSFTLKILLIDDKTSYNIIALCSKNKPDTIYIKRK